MHVDENAFRLSAGRIVPERITCLNNEEKFMSKSIITALLVASFIGGSGAALAYSGQELAPQAKVSLEQARTIALKARPGQITGQELEKENGGSGLRYSFDVKSGGTTYEVGIDAQTGKVLENGADSD